jgi:hypothetical protein
MDVQIDFLTVIVAAFLNMVIGFFWYSKWLFGPSWAKCHHMKEGECRGRRQAIAYTAVVSLIIAYFLAFFEGHLGVTTVTDGMFVGFCLWLGFVATTQISSVIWCKAPWKLFLIDTSGKLLSLLVMSGVIGA